MRWIAQIPPGPDETWVDYIRRSTHESEDIVEAIGASDWIRQQRVRVWKLAGRTAAGSELKWSKRLLMWRPWFRVIPRRNVGHPFKRWDDEIVQLVGGNWPQIASDNALWACLLSGYAERI